MQPLIKPLPYGAKVRKLFAKKFYLSHRDYLQLINSIELGVLARMRDVVAFVDEHGEWLDG